MKKKFSTNIMLFLFISLNFLIIETNSIDNNDFSQTDHISDFTLDFNESNAYNHISTQLEFGFRVPGTSAHNNSAEWIYDQISTITDVAQKHEFSIQKDGQPSYNCQNILGKINPEKEQIVIFGAHWDSRNVAEKDIYNQSQPIPGANDGGSGVGVLLELARVLSSYKNNLSCQVWFLFIDAEDQGYSRGLYGLQDWVYAEGSQVFVEDINEFYNPSKESFECFILLDMVGGTNLEFVKESRTNEDLHNSIFKEGRELGYNQTFSTNPKIMSITDDHLSFNSIGIPVIDLIIDFIAGDWIYHHTHSDDLSHIDSESLKITGRTIESFMKRYYTLGNDTSWKITEESNIFIPYIIFPVLFTTCFVMILRKKREGKKPVLYH